MANPPRDLSGGLNSFGPPYKRSFDITPDGSNSLEFLPQAIWVGTGGNLVVVMRGGMTTTFPNVPAGTMLPIQVTHILPSSTAGGLIGLY